MEPRIRLILCGARILLLLTLLWTSGCGLRMADRGTPPMRETGVRRVNVLSPWYPLQQEDVRLLSDWSAWDTSRHEPVHELTIHRETLRMIGDANRLVLGCYFLFDCLYPEKPPAWDYVDHLTDALLEKRQSRPDVTVAVVLDLIHEAWGDRRSPAVGKLQRHGVDVFFSDRLETRSAQRLPWYEGLQELGRAVDPLTLGLLGAVTRLVGAVPAPTPGVSFDGAWITMNTIANAALLKANHRKLLVVDRNGHFEAMVTTWNPHNGSLYHENHAVVVRGAMAAFIYMVLREDVRKSIEIGGQHVLWAEGSSPRRYLEAKLPALAPVDYLPESPATPTQPRGRFATEQAIEAELLRMLGSVGPGDEVRIQMFYLARVPVLHALLDAGRRTDRPIRILLDPNRTGINYAKDGTPNSQAAAYLLQRADLEQSNIHIRWYDTRGEQNHAKTMSVTNHLTGKSQFTTGSANWTRKNLAGINLESNVFLENMPTINGQFNALFDALWDNALPGLQHSIAYDHAERLYHKHAGLEKWAQQRKLLGLVPMFDEHGRPQLMERELVHW